jgi:hypothetical protein
MTTTDEAARELELWIAEEGAEAEFSDPAFLRCFAEELIAFKNQEDRKMHTITVKADHIARAISLGARGSSMEEFLRTPAGRELEATYSRALGQPHDPDAARAGERRFAELLEREPGIVAVSEPEGGQLREPAAQSAFLQLERKARELFSGGEAKSMREALELAQQRLPDLAEQYGRSMRESAARDCRGQ